MPNRPIAIESFKEVPGDAEIVGIGGIRQPRGEAQEVEVEVIVASDMDAPDFDPARHVSVHWLGCGQLDLVVPGSRWIEGQSNGRAPGSILTAQFTCDWTEGVGTGIDPQPRGRPFPSRRFARSRGFVLRQPRQVRLADGGSRAKRRSEPELVLLPMMELLRSLFGMSSGFLLELFDGIRNPAVSGERGLVSRRLSRVRDDGTVVLEAGRDLSRDEAVIAAAIIADDAIGTLHNSAFQQLSVDLEAREGRPFDLDLGWPWRTPVPMRMEGRWVARENASARFIVSRIEAIGLPLPFKRVEVRHPGSAKGEGSGMPPPEGRLRSANARLVVLTTGRAASTARRPVEVATGILDLTTADDFEVVSVPCGEAVRRDRAGIGEDRRHAAPFGSGGRQPGAAPEVGGAALRRRALPGEAPERSAATALEMTWKALAAACASAGWTLLATPRPSQSRGDPAHGGFDFARESLVSVVLAADKRVVVVDRGSPIGDECSLGLLLPKGRAAGMSDAALAAAACDLCTSVEGRWRSQRLRRIPPRDFDVIAVNRDAQVWRSRDAYAVMLKRRLASALGR